MKPLYSKGDILRPKTFLQLPDQLKEITITGHCKAVKEYFIRDKTGCFYSIPYYLVHIHFKKKEEAALC